MPKLKIVPAKKLIRFLEKQGFLTDRQSGSHVTMIKDSISITIPFHQGKDLGRGIIGAILDDAGIDLETYPKEV